MSKIGSYVDVDSVLWDFHKEFRKRCKEIFNIDPDPSIYNVDTHYNLPADQYWTMIHAIHSSQLKFKPFPWSKDFLNKLHKLEHSITIISGRGKVFMDDLVQWLRDNDLYEHVDRVVCSHHGPKMQYYTQPHIFVYDDSPHVLNEDCGKCITFCIDMPYNKHTKANHRFKKTIECIPVVTKLTKEILEK